MSSKKIMNKIPPLEVRALGKVLLQILVFAVPIISRLESQSKFQLFTLYSGRHIGVPDSVNFCETFRRISEVWGNAQA